MLIALALCLAQAEEAAPLRRAVDRSLPFLEKGGVAWMAQRKCSSCHHATFLVWTHREALARGFAVDAAKLEAWTRWTLDYSRDAKKKDGTLDGGGLDTLAQVILSRPATADPAPYRELAERIRARRKAEGFWEADGQLPKQRRPLDETHDASTMWVLRALGSLGLEDAGAAERLRGRKPGETAESAALHLLTTPSAAALQELLSRRNADGGWGWKRGEPSDALATGQVLYVLSHGTSGAEAARGARDFLLRTQREDGSWRVPTTKTGSKDDTVSTYWGTAWAVLGLLRVLTN